MKIESLLPILLNLMDGRAGKQQPQTPTTPAPEKTIGKFQAPFETGDARSKTMTTTQEAEDPQRPQNQAGNLPDFLPLPLKSPLFPASRYYIQRNEENNRKNAGHNSAVKLFINLETSALGRLWVVITSQAGELAIKFYAEEESYTSIIAEGMPGLTRALQEKGFSPVKVTALTRPGIKSCADIMAPGRYPWANNIFIDLKI